MALGLHGQDLNEFSGAHGVPRQPAGVRVMPAPAIAANSSASELSATRGPVGRTVLR
jgi:hypothetical protein